MWMPPFISMNQPLNVRPPSSGFHRNGALVQRRTNRSSYASLSMIHLSQVSDRHRSVPTRSGNHRSASFPSGVMRGSTRMCL